MERKNVAIIILAVALVASGVGNIILGIGALQITPPPSRTTLIIGTTAPAVLDPIDSWDAPSNDVIQQITETLFWYDVTDPALPLEHLLLEDDSYNGPGDELTLNIKPHVWFHDGKKLDGWAVKWNIDRWLYLTNSTGTLPATTVPAFPSPLLYMPDGVSPIINHTELVDEMTVKIVLNQPIGHFRSLLSYAAFGIISPYSHSNLTYVDLTSEKLIGTGPYKHDVYRTDIEVRFSRWDRYHGISPYFEVLVYTLIDETATRNQAMIGGTIDYLVGADPDLIEQFEDLTHTVVVDGGTSFVFRYFAMRNDELNVTWRAALSHAYNYTYVVEEIMQGNAIRAFPAVPYGMAGNNASVQVAHYDIPLARQLMQSMGFGTTWAIGSQIGDVFTPGADEALWEAADFATQAFGAPIEMNMHSGSSGTRKLNDRMIFDLNRIGVELNEVVREWEDFLDDGENGNLHGIWYIGWGPDFNDPINMLDPLFNPTSSSNFFKINDPQVTTWLTDAFTETVEATRLDLLRNVQGRLFDERYGIFGLMCLWTSLVRIVHKTTLLGVPYNDLGEFRWHFTYL